MAGESFPGKVVPAAKTLQCPSCGAAVAIRAPGKSLSVACSHCKTLLDLTNPELSILHSFAKAKAFEPIIPLGVRGKLRGETWEVIGFLRKADGSGAYQWDEYLLFNPFKGFRWLVQSNGHWSFVTMTKQQPKAVAKGAVYLGKRYTLFLKGQAKILYVEGEFYWKVLFGTVSEVADYIRPPEMLSREEQKDEVTWSLGEYVEMAHVREGFKTPNVFPAPQGVAPNQPSPFGENRKRIYAIAAACSLTLLADQIVTSMASSEEQVLQYAGTFDPRMPKEAAAKLPVVTQRVSLAKGPANVKVTSYVEDLSNDWAEFGIDLVNAASGESIGLEQGVEYYFGSDSDGPWTEGSRWVETVVSAIPAGEYDLMIEPSGAPQTKRPLRYSVVVTRDVPDWSNFWWGLCLLLIYPLWVLVRSYMHEVGRWSDSDYSPYQSS